MLLPFLMRTLAAILFYSQYSHLNFVSNNCLGYGLNQCRTELCHTSPHPLNNSPVSVPFTLATAMNLLPKFCLEAPAIHDSLTSMYFKDLLTAICKTCFNLSNDFIFVQTAHSISQNKCSEP